MDSTHALLQTSWPASLVFRLTDSTRRVSTEEFEEYCRLNPDLRLELTAQGELVIMSPAGNDASNHNAALSGQLYNWSKKDGRGRCFDSSAGFTFPDGAILSPDASWALKSRQKSLSAKERRGFAPLCPDFVAEIKSPSDSIRALKAKMKDFLKNGAGLGVLIDPDTKKVYLYRPDQDVVSLDNPETVDLSPEMPGFVLEMNEI